MSRSPTPLQEYLHRRRVKVSEVGAGMGQHLPRPPSQPSLSQWTTGSRVPSAAAQIAMMLATQGEVSPLDWARWQAKVQRSRGEEGLAGR